MRSASGSRLRLACLSFCGLIAGHLAAYGVVERDPHVRSGLLESTGHGSWTFVIFAAAILFLLGLGSAIVDRVAGRSEAYRTCASRLALLQVSGFVLLEAVERAAEHGASLSFLTEPAVFVGVLIQIAIAAFAPLLLRAVAASVARILGRRSRVHRERSVWEVPLSKATPSFLRDKRCRPRGPPFLPSIA